MSDELLTLRETAKLLNLSEPRIYQLDHELCPVYEARGTKTRIRRYRPELVEKARLKRLERYVGAVEEHDPNACAFCGKPSTMLFGFAELRSCHDCNELMGERDALDFLEHVLKIAKHQGG